MNLFHLLRRPHHAHRRSRYLNWGCVYVGLSALFVVVAKSLKYSDGGSRGDLPWAILIILGAGLAGGILWHWGRLLFGLQTKGEMNNRVREADAPGDDPRR